MSVKPSGFFFTDCQFWINAEGRADRQIGSVFSTLRRKEIKVALLLF
jgi:hypothetical protein